ncbi:MAG: hypothetical protein O3C27_16285 [Actinomycetota bacterium]|nr:hypothetical protein [Actinomycetota bacterium]
MNRGALLLAQQAADETGQTIRLIIMGLLAVAVLLALLTVWYWRHTDPRRRLRPVADPIVIPEPLVDARGRGAGEGQRVPAASFSEIDAEEWLRLTGPQALPRTPRRLDAESSRPV